MRVFLRGIGEIISIHTLLAESDPKLVTTEDGTYISIHTLLAESDVRVICQVLRGNTISIHTLLAESDQIPDSDS